MNRAISYISTRWYLAPILLGAVFLLTFHNAGQAQSASIEEGSVIYAANCAGCHGADGSGLGGRLINSTRTLDEMVAVTTNGDGGMPAFSGTLTPDQILSTICYVKSEINASGLDPADNERCGVPPATTSTTTTTTTSTTTTTTTTTTSTTSTTTTTTSTMAPTTTTTTTTTLPPTTTVPPTTTMPPMEEKVTICHVTNSPKNPYVVITVGAAAFDGMGKSDHSHHVSKDGRMDALFVDGECQFSDSVGGVGERVRPRMRP